MLVISNPVIDERNSFVPDSQNQRLSDRAVDYLVCFAQQGRVVDQIANLNEAGNPLYLRDFCEVLVGTPTRRGRC